MAESTAKVEQIGSAPARAFPARGGVTPVRRRARARLPGWLAVVLLMLLVWPTPAAANGSHSKHGERPRRIVQRADDRDTRVVRDCVHSDAKDENDLGRVEATLVLERVAIAFKPSSAQESELAALVAEQQDPRSPRYQTWLSPDEYAARFGMSPADLAEVSAWLRAQGLSVGETSRSGNELYFSGTAAQIEDAFRTEIHRYRVDGEVHYANATEPSVPEAFADVVLALRNLSDFRPKPRLRRPGVAPRFTSSISGSHFLAPDDLATIYNADALHAAGYDGTGERIAVIGQTALGPGNSTADIAAFRAAAGLPTANLQQILVPGTGSSTVCSDDILEAHLDVEWAGAVARNATVVYVFVGVAPGRTCATTSANVWDALQHAVANNLAPIISTSYGACEASNGLAFARMVRAWMQQANAQGQTITAASGDAGAADCEPRGSAVASSGFAVDVPASIPEVTGVGGTEFRGDVANPGAYWSATNNAANGSATQYIPEVGWDDTTLSVFFGGGLAASGGGASGFFSKPSWQSGAGVPADGLRHVPDVALAASASHDGYLICSQGSCVSGFRNFDQTLTVIGGTSAASPSFAGILALIKQGTGSNGLGNVNPKLYALAASAPAAFHDITSGSNAVPCSPGSTSCPAVAPFQFGYSAGVGYDQVTGLGSVDAFALGDNWAAKIATATSVSASSAAILPGTTATFTAAITPLAAGTGSPANGRVQFAIDGVDAGAPVPVAAVSGAYRAAYTPSALAGGSHTATAEYLGNLVYLGSTSAPVAISVADFSVSTNPASIALSAGGAGSAVVTVASADGFEGTVNLTCAPSAAAAQVTCSLTPPSLTLSAGVPSQLATLTINTTAAQTAGIDPFATGGVAVLAASLAFAVPRRRRRQLFAHALALLLLVGAGASCGGGGGGGGGGAAATNAGTPAGNYAITVSATSGAISHAASVALAVQ